MRRRKEWVSPFARVFSARYPPELYYRVAVVEEEEIKRTIFKLVVEYERESGVVREICIEICLKRSCEYWYKYQYFIWFSRDGKLVLSVHTPRRWINKRKDIGDGEPWFFDWNALDAVIVERGVREAIKEVFLTFSKL